MTSPTDLQRFAERLAERLDSRAAAYDEEARRTRLSYPGEVGRAASSNDHRKACDYREIAALVREAAKEET